MKTIAPLLALLLVACASAKTMNEVQPGDAEKAIARENQRFMSAVRSGNVDQIADFYSELAVFMPPNAPAVSGRDAIRQVWSGMFASGNFDLKLTTDDVTQSGDLAAERGHYDMTFTAKQGGASDHELGKYVVVWRKLDGRWRAVTDIFNSDGAPASAGGKSTG